MSVEIETAGYSGTPLAKKLGLKSGDTVLTLNAPDDYRTLLGDPYDIKIIADKPAGRPDVIHFFTKRRDELFAKLADLRNVIKQDGSIWVSWYKKAAKLPTEITEDTIREAALPLGLVDIKVCAVDDSWSGLKLVIRKENRV